MNPRPSAATRIMPPSTSPTSDGYFHRRRDIPGVTQIGDAEIGQHLVELTDEHRVHALGRAAQAGRGENAPPPQNFLLDEKKLIDRARGQIQQRQETIETAPRRGDVPVLEPSP